jgi:hypothetical protein
VKFLGRLALGLAGPELSTVVTNRFGFCEACPSRILKLMSNPSSTPAEDLAQTRLAQVFKFLKELNELRNPVARDLSGSDVLRLDAWPAHPCVQIRRGDREEDEAVATEAEIEPLIRIQRAKLSQCPTPPDPLTGWLKPGWPSVEGEVEVARGRSP